MKKGFILIASMLFLAVSGLSAGVTIEKDGDQLFAVFTYEDEWASSVGLVGDMQGWDLGSAIPFTQDGDTWTLRQRVREDQTLIYKFSVDGEWTEDPSAPATQDDGFGGFNGVVNVAALLAAQEGREFVMPTINFGSYTSLRVVTHFQDDAIHSELKANSYFKIRGDAMDNVPFFLEAQVLQGGMTLFAQADEDSFKWQNLADLVFNPFYPLNDGGSQPLFGHLRIGLETEYVNATVYNWYAKTKRHESGRNLFYYSTYRELDAWNGSLELGKRMDIEDINLEWFVAFSKRPNWSGAAVNNGAILRGIQSYVQAATAGYDFQLMYNVREVAAADMDYFFGNLNHQLAVGAKGAIIPGALNFRLQFITHFINSDADQLAGDAEWQPIMGADFMDLSALALQATYTSDMFGGRFAAQFDGNTINLGHFFGRNDGDEDANDLNRGLMTLVANPWVKPIADLQVGLDNTIKLDNPLSESGAAYSSDHKFYANYDFLGLYAKFGLADVADEIEFSFNEVGATANLTDMVGMDLNTYAAFVMGGNNEIHLIADSQFDELMGAALGLLVRLEGDNPVADGSAFGVSAGFRMTVPALNYGEFFTNFGYKSWLFDGDEKADRKIDGGRFDSSDDLGVANARLAIGMKWDF